MSAKRGLARLVGGLSPILLIVASCSVPTPPDGDYPPLQGADAGSDADAAAADTSGGGPLVADGTWLMWHETATCVEVMSVNIEALTETLAVVQLQRDPGGVIHHTYRNCSIEQTPIVGVATKIPQAVVDTIPVRDYIAILDADAVGSAYATQVSIELWGVKLADPELDVMPTDPADPRIYDQDNDGKPGVTLDLGNGQCTMEVIQRGTFQWKGTIESSTRISGGGYNLTQQIVLHASSGFCSSQFHTWNPPNTARFAIMRADGKSGAINLDTNQDGVVSCEEVRAYGSAPFEPRKVDNKRCQGDQ
ncbi:MAG: hypothetical protein HY898_11605 [Deltaproteobacteria bacterium]|nr:hypothetical protein [Deltaproteobacteria bacterium]